MAKAILIICDALRDDVARECMGYLEHLVEERIGSRYSVQGGLPSLSRPMYETIHTGVPVHQHGIVSNITSRRSTMPSIFSAAREHGKTTAAAAYSWYYDLYVNVPYDPIMGREHDDENSLIQHGRFYTQDEYPDIELFQMAMMLVLRHFPDYLLVHPMGLDTIGHKFGGGTMEYRNQVMLQDQIMANMIPQALAAGYSILVTGDHGMSAMKNHNGTTPDVRQVPLYLIQPDVPGRGDTGELISTMQLAPTILDILGVPIPETMKHPSLISK